MVIFEISFYDLTKNAQQRLLQVLKIDSPEALNLDVQPLAWLEFEEPEWEEVKELTKWQVRKRREALRWRGRGCSSCGGGLRDWHVKWEVCFFCRHRLRVPAEMETPISVEPSLGKRR